MSDVLVTDTMGGESPEFQSQDIGSSAEPIVSGTPGMVLRRARESHGNSIADVVQVIRFSARQIEALERDDYASLPGSTAVRGMVRNYAKFLKLDAMPLLAQLDPAVPVAEADVRPPTNMGEAEQPRVVERIPSKMIFAGVAMLMLALTGYWYSGLPQDERLMHSVFGMMGSSGIAPAANRKDDAAVPVVAPAPAVIAPIQTENSVVSPAPLPGTGLRVEFDDHSWIEIRDATQKVVFVGEYPAGTRQNVDGKAPFQLWIGRASSVRIFMGERGIDLKPHTREDVARFSVE